MTDVPRAGEQARLPVAPPPSNHGNTTAAWVTVTVVLVGAVVSSLAMIAGQDWLVWAGAGVIVVGLVAGRVLRMAGLGQPVRGTRAEPDIHPRPRAD
jgi:uncharacterized membrane protein YecN with MAPEG domain